MNKQEIYAFLKEHRIPHEITEHAAVFNMEEVSHLDLPHPEADAKNIFIRDKRSRIYYLITVKGAKRVDLKAFRQIQGTGPLGFASAENLMAILGLIPGSVTPLGLLNDHERKVRFFLDRAFLEGEGLIGVHPNENDATVWMQAEDLLAIIREHGNQTELIEI